MNVNTMSYWISLLVLLLLVAGQQQLANARLRTYPCTVNIFRLPTRVKPMSYDLKLVIDPREETFSGSVKISLNIGEMDSDALLKSRSIRGQLHPLVRNPKNIILNADGLIFTSGRFTQDARSEQLKIVHYDHENKILVVPLREAPVTEKNALLKLEFQGRVQEEPKGLFRSSHETGKFTVATYFETAYARRVFPCFDEPEFKAIFKLKIKHPHEFMAYSNCKRIKSRPISENWLYTLYEHTSSMPCHLFGFAIGNFEKEWKYSRNHMRIMVRVTEGMKKQAEKIQDIALQAYRKAAEIFEAIPQPLVGIDIVAVDYGPIAMSHFGFITMRWDLLSADPDKIKPNEWVRAVTVLVTQMIHQWLDNLFTMRWWDERWLIDGLAGYFASEMTDEMLPPLDSKLELYTLVDTTFSALNDDDNPQKARPINGEDTAKADQFEVSFDSFTYKKSVALVRMFVEFFGERTFMSAIQDLIKLKSTGHLVVVDHFWNALESKAPQHGNLANVAGQWAKRTGYPTIYVDLKDNTLYVGQQQPPANCPAWSVPIQCEFHIGEGSIAREFLLSDLEFSFNVPELFEVDNDFHWFKCNANYQGYYRVWYLSDVLLAKLNRAISSREMQETDRMQILGDYYANAKQYDNTDGFELMLENFWRGKATKDGEMLLITKMLTELYDTEWPLALSELAQDVLLRYYNRNGGVFEKTRFNMLKQYARSQVVDYLVNKLQNQQVLTDIEPLTAPNANVPPFLQQVIENLRERSPPGLLL